jgi:hypothetical protein
MRKTLAWLASITLLVAAAAYAQQSTEKQSSEKPSSETKPTDKKATEKKAKPAKDKASKEKGTKEVGGLSLGKRSETDNLLDAAIDKLEGLKQYQADVRQVVEMLGYKFTGNGRYAVAPDYKMLFELKVQLTDTTGTLIEVSDGQWRWRSQKILDVPKLEKLDMKRVREIIEKPEFDKTLREQLVKQMGFGGLLPALYGIRDTIKFDNHEEADLEGTPVYLLRGHWRDEALAQVPFRGQQASASNLPWYMPSNVVVWIGRDNGWPYRIEMQSVKKAQGMPTKITLEFLNPQIGVELPESTFAFEPPTTPEAVDLSDTICKNLENVIQQAEDAKRRGGTAAPESAPGTSLPAAASDVPSSAGGAAPTAPGR